MSARSPVLRAPALVVCLAAGAAALPGCAAPGPERTEAVPAAVESEVHRLRIFGMNCPVRCPLEVRDQLRKVPGVLEAEVDYDTKEATVRVAAGTDLDTVVAGVRPPYSAHLR